MKITVCSSKTTSTKFPVPENSETKQHTFSQKFPASFKDLVQLFQNEYVLTFPLSGTADIKMRRSSNEFGNLSELSSELFIVDFNDVLTLKDQEKIIDLFRPFQCAIIETRSCNNVYNFNVRVLIRSAPMTRTKMQSLLKTFATRLNNHNGSEFVIDTTTYRRAQILAPTLRPQGLLYQNQHGLILPPDFLDDNAGYLSQPTFDAAFKNTDNEFFAECFKLFNELGFNPVNGFDLTKEPILFKQGETEIKYKWFSDLPTLLIPEQGFAGSFDQVQIVDVKKELKKRFPKLFKNFKRFEEIKPFDYPTRPKIEYRSVNVEKLTGDEFKEEVNEIFRENGVLFLRSPMGTGKTKILKNINTRNCVLITPRIQLAKEIADAAGWKLYKDGKIDKNENYVIQFDQLFKIPELDFNCVVFDEFMTLQDHFLGTHRNALTISMFTKLLKCPRVMCLDAFLFENVSDFFPTQKIWFCDNDFRDPTNINIHNSLESFINEICFQSFPSAVSCVSVKFQNELEQILKSATHKTIKTVSAETSVKEREKTLDEFNEGNLDILLYTPAFGVGINILKPCKHFHFDGGNAVSIIQSIQMTKRTRLAPSIDVFVKKTSLQEFPSFELEKFKTCSESLAGLVQFDGRKAELTEAGLVYSIMQYHQKMQTVDLSKGFNLFAKKNFANVMRVQRDKLVPISIKVKNIETENVDVKTKKVLETIRQNFPFLEEEIISAVELDEMPKFFRLIDCFILASKPESEMSKTIKRQGDFEKLILSGMLNRWKNGETFEKHEQTKLKTKLGFEDVRTGLFSKSVEPRKSWIELAEKICSNL